MRLKSAGRKLGVKVVVKTAGKEVGVAFVTTNVCFKCGVRLSSYVCFTPRCATFAARTMFDERRWAPQNRCHVLQIVVFVVGRRADAGIGGGAPTTTVA